MSETTTVVIRQYKAQTDSSLLYCSWINALWYAIPENKDKAVGSSFYKEASNNIKQLIKATTTSIHMACLSDDPNLMIGYSVLSGKNLEFVYVKFDYRKKGIAKLLTRGFETVSPPQTRIGKSLTKKKNLKVQGEQDERPKEATQTD